MILVSIIERCDARIFIRFIRHGAQATRAVRGHPENPFYSSFNFVAALSLSEMAEISD